MRALTRNVGSARSKLPFPGCEVYGPADWAKAIQGCTGVVNLAGACVFVCVLSVLCVCVCVCVFNGSVCGCASCSYVCVCTIVCQFHVRCNL